GRRRVRAVGPDPRGARIAATADPGADRLPRRPVRRSARVLRLRRVADPPPAPTDPHRRRDRSLRGIRGARRLRGRLSYTSSSWIRIRLFALPFDSVFTTRTGPISPVERTCV